MGIKQLTKLLNEYAPGCIKEQALSDFTGRKIAIDASMAIYQFLVAVRTAGSAGAPAAQLTNEAGDVTSHLQGLWYRTLKFIDSGIKPVYVFDGKPPELKGGELAKRRNAKEKAEADLAAAKEAGDAEEVDRFARRTVKMDKGHIDECKTMLRLMGLPVVDAPCEAEAQCAALAKAGKVYAAASEDMDTLTFGTPKLVRKMWASEASKTPILEFNLEKMLAALELTQDQFIDVCILSGCDYAETIKGIGSTTAFKLVKDKGSLDAVIKSLDPEKYKVPEDVDYAEVKSLFIAPEVADPAGFDFKWAEPDESGLKKYLVEEKGFNIARVEKGIATLKKARMTGSQSRMDSFFSTAPSTSSSAVKPAAVGAKRKGAPSAKPGPAKKK